MKTYRNIYFYTKKPNQTSGNIDVYYYGHIFQNAKYIKNFKQNFDATLDLKIECDSCASKKYRNFIKVKKES